MRKLISALRSSRLPVITAHIQPDGDAVGSMVALKRALTKLGSNCRAISSSPVSRGLRFFLNNEEIRASGLINAAAVAKKFGGGGHSGAAGVKLDGEMVEIVFQVLEEIEKRFIRARREGVTEERRSQVWART